MLIYHSHIILAIWSWLQRGATTEQCTRPMLAESVWHRQIRHRTRNGQVHLHVQDRFKANVCFIVSPLIWSSGHLSTLLYCPDDATGNARAYSIYINLLSLSCRARMTHRASQHSSFPILHPPPSCPHWAARLSGMPTSVIQICWVRLIG